MSTTARSIRSLLLLAGLSSSGTHALAQWSQNEWTAQRLGYTDAIHTRNDGQQQSPARGSLLASDGLIVGISERYQGSEFTGSTAWASTLSQPLRRIGFFDAIHTSSEGFQNSDVGIAVGLTASRNTSVNALGQSIGFSTRYDGAFENGRTAWRWDPILGTQRVGLTGNLAQGLFSSPVNEEYSQPISIDDSGRVIGWSRRYEPDTLLAGVLPPSSAWIQIAGSNPTILDLPGTDYVRPFDGFQRHEPRAMNNSGLVVGISYRFDAFGAEKGQAAWSWTQATGTQRIGPQGQRYLGFDGTEYAYTTSPTEAGDRIGASWTFFDATADVGRDAWIIRAGTTTPELIGLRGADHTRADGFQRSEPTTYRVTGPLRIAGYSQLFLDLGGFIDGRSSWSWTPTEGSLEIGLRDEEHTGPNGERDGFPVFTLPNGAIAGYSDRLGNSIFDRTGQSNWVWLPPSPGFSQGQTIRLGIFDALHTSSDGFQRSEIYGASEAGSVFGVSYRYNGRDQFDIGSGRTLWVYDTTTRTQTNLVFNQSSAGDAVALPLGMSSDGVLTGYFLEYQGTQIVAQRAFAWSAARGIITINQLLNGGPLSQGIENCFFADSLENASGLGIIYAMPQGVLWNPAGGGWATAYRVTRNADTLVCDSIDFNNDSSLFDPTDVDAFFSVFSEGACIPESATCNDVDFNNDGSLFDPCDLDAFLLVFSEGPCTPCGT
jgi:hypothetical protein